MKCKLILYALSVLFLATACGPRQIPEEDMQAIIRDIFLVNAYQDLYGGGHNTRFTDSTDLYSPILKDHGYDLADFRYTLDRWTLQKSSKLSELIDGATVDIQRENEMYLGRQRVQERLDSMVIERYRDTVYRHLDSIRIRNPRDRDRLRFTVAAAAGSYQIRYRYLIDPTDRSPYVVMRYAQLDTAGHELLSQTRSLQRGRVGWIDFTFESVPGIDSLRVDLADYSGRNLQTVAFRADSVYVFYNQPIATARARYLSDAFHRFRPLPPPAPFPPPDGVTRPSAR